MLYASLADARREVRAGATNTTEDADLLFALRAVSRRIDREFGSRREVFAPTLEARRLTISRQVVHSRDRTLHVAALGWLLSLTGVTVGTTTLTVPTQVEAWPDAAMPPFPYLRLTSSAQDGWYDYCESDATKPLQAVVTGVWGIHRDWANAWHKVDDLASDITASATSLAVADVDGADLHGLTPRLSAGNLLRIGTEYLEVTATNTDTNAVTVRRGVNGSTAAAHAQNDDVEVWQVEEPVRRVVARQAALMNARRGAFTTTEITGLGEVRYPADFLTELRAVLQDYAMGV